MLEMNALLTRIHASVRGTMLRKGLIPIEPGLIANRQSFLTWHRRPQKVPIQTPIEGADFSNFGIVLQGPVLERWNFTLETLIGYSKLFPGARLVLSTWLGIPSKIIKEAEAHGVTVVCGSMPSNRGPSNFNLQLKSTRAGLEVLHEFGVAFAVKQRTDQRMYSSTALSYLAAMTNFYPSQDGRPRLFSTSLNSFIDREYGLSDMFQFSSLHEVIRYWDVDQVESEFELPEPLERSFSETYLTFKYLKDRAGSSQIPSWHEGLVGYLGVVDASSLDMLWPKYSRREFLWRRYPQLNGLQELNHSLWVSLLSRTLHNLP